MTFENAIPDPQSLIDIQTVDMPYGKYKGRKLIQIPVHYLEWMAKSGFPAGRLGMLLSTVHVIKTNGLEHLFHKNGGSS